jgi:hypothetical protein
MTSPQAALLVSLDTANLAVQDVGGKGQQLSLLRQLAASNDSAFHVPPGAVVTAHALLACLGRDALGLRAGVSAAELAGIRARVR